MVGVRVLVGLGVGLVEGVDVWLAVGAMVVVRVLVGLGVGFVDGVDEGLTVGVLVGLVVGFKSLAEVADLGLPLVG